MIPDIEPDEIRQDHEISQVERKLTDCAVRFALLGEIETARKLVEILTHHGSTLGSWIYAEFLKFGWNETGQWPAGWPPGDRSAIPPEESYQESRNSSWVGLPEAAKGVSEDRDALDTCLSVEDGHFADSMSGSAAMYKGQRLVRALEISIKLHGIKPESKTAAGDMHLSKKKKDSDGQAVEQQEADVQLTTTDLDRESASILNKIVARLRANQQIKYLGDAKRLWPFYARGLLVDAVGVSREDVQVKGQALLEAFNDRFETGYVPSQLDGKSVKELLELGDQNTKHFLEREGGDYGPVPDSLFKQPATADEIDALEARLQTVLPDDYKEFLRISNGFGEEDMESGIWNGCFPDPALHDVSKPKWIGEEYFQLPVDLLELPREYKELVGMENKQSEPGADFDWHTCFPLFDRVLEIGVRDIDNLWLVHPQLVEQVRETYHDMYVQADEKQKKVIVRAMESFAGSKEAFESMHWCCAKWSSGGSATMRFYASFTKYLEHVVLASMEDKMAGFE